MGKPKSPCKNGFFQFRNIGINKLDMNAETSFDAISERLIYALYNEAVYANKTWFCVNPEIDFPRDNNRHTTWKFKDTETHNKKQLARIVNQSVSMGYLKLEVVLETIIDLQIERIRLHAELVNWKQNYGGVWVDIILSLYKATYEYTKNAEYKNKTSKNKEYRNQNKNKKR